MLQVLNALNTRAALTEMAAKSRLPWAMLSDSVMEFVGDARTKEKCFFAFADDSETAMLLAKNTALQIGFAGGCVTVYGRKEGTERLAKLAKEKFKVKWIMIESTFLNFLETCYSNNYVLAVADDVTVALLDQKLQNGNVKFRLKT